MFLPGDVSIPSKEKKENAFIFKDPKEYERLSNDEKKALTAKMKGQHRGWVNSMHKGKSALKGI